MDDYTLVAVFVDISSNTIAFVGLTIVFIAMKKHFTQCNSVAHFDVFLIDFGQQ